MELTAVASSQGHDEDVQEQMDDEQGISVACKAVGYDLSSSKGQDTSDQTLDKAFGKFLQGEASHRLAAAKALLCSTEPAVIAELAKWRKGAN